MAFNTETINNYSNKALNSNGKKAVAVDATRKIKKSIEKATEMGMKDNGTVEVKQFSNVAGKSFSNKAKVDTKKAVVKDITDTKTGEKLNNKDVKKGKHGIAKKIAIGGLIVLTVLGAKFGYDHFNKNNNTVEQTAIVETVKQNDFFSEEEFINNSVDMMLDYYEKSNGKFELSAKDVAFTLIGSNINTIDAETLNDLGITGHYSAKEVTKSNLQTVLSIKNLSREKGVKVDAKLFTSSYNQADFDELMNAAIEYGKGNKDAAMLLDSKNIANGSLYDNHNLNAIGLSIANDASQNSNLYNLPAICQNNEKISTYISQNEVSFEADYTRVESIALDSLKAQGKTSADGQKFEDILNQIRVKYEKGKENIKLVEEKPVIDQLNESIPKDKSVDEAVKNGAVVNEEKKTINLNPGKVVDKTQETTPSSTPTYKDNSGKTTTKEEVTKENVKTGETTVINGKTYQRGADGEFYEVNQNAGKGVQVQSQSTTTVTPKVVEEKKSTTVQESKPEVKTETKVETKTEKQALEEVKEKVQQQSSSVQVTEKFYDMDGNEYNSEAELMAAMEAKMSR